MRFAFSAGDTGAYLTRSDEIKIGDTLYMKKLALVIVALVLGAAVLPGCKVEGEVDDDVRTNVGVAQ